MGTTPNFSGPSPESSDFVADGATAIENLADAVDTTLDGLQSTAFPFRIAAGSIFGGAASTTVTYPSARFTVTPLPIFINADSSSVHPAGTAFSSTSFTYINSVAANATLFYVAIQMTSTTAAG